MKILALACFCLASIGVETGLNNIAKSIHDNRPIIVINSTNCAIATDGVVTKGEAK